jgi:hypothetical protein
LRNNEARSYDGLLFELYDAKGTRQFSMTSAARVITGAWWVGKQLKGCSPIADWDSQPDDTTAAPPPCIDYSLWGTA